MASELERLIIENAKMQECRRNLQITIQSLEGQLHIAQECLYYREARTGLIHLFLNWKLTCICYFIHNKKYI